MMRWIMPLVICWGLVSEGVLAAPVRTGTPIGVNAGQTNTGNTTVTVPNDADLMVCGVSGYIGTAGFFSGGSLTVGGNAFTLITGGDSSTDFWMGTIGHRLVTTTRGSQTLAWDWTGTSNPGDNVGIYCSWYKDLDTASPIRSSSCGAQNGGGQKTTGTLTAQTGDLIVAAVASVAGSEQTFTWANATSVAEFTIFLNTDGSIGEASPTGNQTVSATPSPDGDGTVCAVTIKPSAAGSLQLRRPPLIY